jgi:hypothetical protein
VGEVIDDGVPAVLVGVLLRADKQLRVTFEVLAQIEREGHTAGIGHVLVCHKKDALCR